MLGGRVGGRVGEGEGGEKRDSKGVGDGGDVGSRVESLRNGEGGG